jgi:hypothetical protein
MANKNNGCVIAVKHGTKNKDTIKGNFTWCGGNRAGSLRAPYLSSSSQSSPSGGSKQILQGGTYRRDVTRAR